MFDSVGRTGSRASVLTLALALLLGCVQESGDPIPGNLLVGAKVQNSGVPNTSRLVDGEVPVEGDHWDTGITARFENPTASVTWDLGDSKPVRAALVQGDNNDVYILSGSADGKAWETLWEGGPVEGAGMRTRQGELNGNARYLRLTAKDGDQLFSVGELAVFSDLPKGWPKLALNRIEGVPPAADGSPAASSWSVSVGVLVAAAAILMLLSRKRRPTEPATEGGSTGGGTSPAP
jgi:hypothetical protein